MDVAARDPAVKNIAADGDPQTIEEGAGAKVEGVADSQRIQQALRRVFVAAVAGIQHRAVDLVGNQPHRARTGVADDDGISAHRVQCHRGVDQGFALLHRTLRGVHVDHVGPQPLAGDFEAQQRAGAVFEEGVDDRQAGQQPGALLGLAVQRHPLFRLVEQEQQFMRGKPRQAD